eukprot:1146110-Pelagomonas_calceolata.AAC.14
MKPVACTAQLVGGGGLLLQIDGRRGSLMDRGLCELRWIESWMDREVTVWTDREAVKWTEIPVS